jgi:HD superfamily phosphohydrolase
VKNPEVWICKLEKLLANNEAFFSSKTAMSRYNKLYFLIEKKRTELQSSSVKEPVIKTPKKFINAESEDRHFSFYEIKKQLENIIDDNQKILLLTKEMFEYQQASIEFINQKTPIYDAQCKKEIENIYALQKIEAAIKEAQIQKAVGQMPFKKMQINCNLNQFIDVYYQFTRELFVDGKSMIDGSVNDLVAIIVNSYVDKDGKEISPETVKTILTPSRTEKRPKPHKRIDIDKML